MACLVAGLVGVIGTTGAEAAPPPGVVVSQVYGGGSNGGASHTHDFVELYNPGDDAVPLTGLSIQYASAMGTGNFGTSTQLTELSGTIEPHRYFLVQEATATTPVGSPLPAPDLTDTTPINLSGTDGKVALVSGTTTLGCNGGSQPCSDAQKARILDLVGYGGANFYEGSAPAPRLTSATSAQRARGGCQDTDDNAADFTAAPTAPRNGSSAPRFCTADPAPVVVSTNPGRNAADAAPDATITVDFSEAVLVSGSWFNISCTVSGVHSAAVSGGPTSYTLTPDVAFAEADSCTVTISAAQVADEDANDPPDGMDADAVWSFTTVAPTYSIAQIQGAAHLSPYAGQLASYVPGVVTAVRNNGFWMQDPSPDGNDPSSEGIFVFTSTTPTVVAGEAVTVSGRVTEFRPGASDNDNLTTTEIATGAVYPAGPGAAVAPTVVGAGGRVPPGATIEDDAAGSVETGGVFDPAQDGIDFYESLEGMLVQVNDAAVVGPTNGNRETWVLGDGGAGAAPRTNRGGIVITPTDFNPERIQLDDVLAGTLPVLDVGDRIPGATVGVLSYDFGNFELLPLQAPVAVAGGLEQEVAVPPQAGELSVATYNVENLDPGDSSFARHADLIVNHLRSPDLIAVEEIQDNNGPTTSGGTDASATFDALVTAIADAGGPAYSWRQINPLDGQDGGEPGGNIRVGFLFRTDRGLTFVDRPGGDATTPTEVFRSHGDAHLTLSPGRVDPANPAWAATRKPLAGEFTWRGKTLIVIANHFSSKGGDDPLFGRWQPPVRSSEPKRHQQAASVNGFVRDVLTLDRRALVVVLGDINDFEFSETTQILEGGGALQSLLPLLPKAERYSYVFEGNSQVLDQVLGSPAVLAALRGFDVVHVNAEFADQASDHDPSVARLGFD